MERHGGLTITITELELSGERVRAKIVLSELGLTLLDASSSTPVAGLLKSGALDLSKPGNLVKMLPKRPDAIVETSDDGIGAATRRFGRRFPAKCRKRSIVLAF